MTPVQGNAMETMICESCGKATKYNEGIEGILSCPHCGEKLFDFGTSAPGDNQTVPSGNANMPPPLDDPLRVFWYLNVTFIILITGILVLLYDLSRAAHRRTDLPWLSPERVANLRFIAFFVTSLPWLCAWWLCFTFLQILPFRKVNAFYLRSFVNDERTLPIRQGAQKALGYEFRLSGIRDPRRRLFVVSRWLLTSILVFRYCTPKYMNLEAGSDWKARLWRSLGDARCALIDVSELTQFVMEELELCRNCLGFKRILFIGDNSRDSAGWKAHLGQILGLDEHFANNLEVAIWTNTPTGRENFRREVCSFAARLPKETAGLKLAARPSTAATVLPDGSVPTEAKADYGWLEVCVGLALAGIVSLGLGFLKQVQELAVQLAYQGIMLALFATASWAFVRYLIDLGPCIQRTKAVVLFGTPIVLFPFLIGLFVNVVQKERHAAERAVHTNNLKQIGLAIHNIHDTYKYLPAAIGDNDGKPLLSWRVAILPWLDEPGLYRQFDLDKPWDHLTNKTLIAKMPRIFMMPGVKAEEGMTHYRSFVGPGTMLEPFKLRGKIWTPRYTLSEVPDGTSNTIMIVEAKEPMIWTKPDDLRYDRKGPLPNLGVRPDGFHVVLGDGSVRFIPATISEATLRAALTADDGLPLGPDWDREMPDR
jgi:hypothetical protein